MVEARCGIGYLHTGIEKNMEVRSFTQGVTFCTRMDYLTPLHQEAAYVLSVERLLGIEDEITERSKIIRVLMMELNRISSHLVCIATGGMEIGALTVMTIGFRDREMILDVFEAVTGVRMNHAYFRPGGVAADIDDHGMTKIAEAIDWLERRLPEYAAFCNENPIFIGRLGGVGKWTSPVAWRWGSPVRCCARPTSPGICANSSPTAVTRPTSSTYPPGTPLMPTVASGSGRRRCGSPCGSSNRPMSACSPRRGNR